ncbi:MAG: TolC family protein [bacterium]|nr:TolC family protein [bacterium]
MMDYRSKALVALLLPFLAAAAGCFGPLAKRLADKETYPIIAEKERAALGKSSPFTIEPTTGTLTRRVLEKAGTSADMLSTSGLKVTMADVLELAIDNSRDYQTRKENLYLSALSLTDARHEFSPIFSGSVSARATRRPSGATGIERFGEVVSDVAVTKLFATGARITVGLTNDFLRVYSSPESHSATGTLAASLVQPLLQGAGPLVTLENLTQAERNVIYAVRTFARYQKNFIVDRVSDYYRLLQAYDEIENEYQSYQRLVVNRQRAEALQREERLAAFEVDQAHQDEISAKNRWINARTTYALLLDQFKLNLGLPIELNIQPDMSELERLRKLYENGLIELAVPLEAAQGLALTNRLDLLTARESVVDVGRRMGIAENALLPALDLTLNASLPSEGNDQSLNFSWDDRTYGGRLDLELPLDRKSERNDYRRAVIDFEQGVREADQLRNQILVEVRDSYNTVDKTRQNYDIQLASLKLAEKRVDNVQLLLDVGREGVSIRDQLDAESSLRDARNSLTQVLVTYTIARLQFYKSIESLEIDEKGMWNENPKHAKL